MTYEDDDNFNYHKHYHICCSVPVWLPNDL